MEVAADPLAGRGAIRRRLVGRGGLPLGGRWLPLVVWRAQAVAAHVFARTAPDAGHSLHLLARLRIRERKQYKRPRHHPILSASTKGVQSEKPTLTVNNTTGVNRAHAAAGHQTPPATPSLVF